MRRPTVVLAAAIVVTLTGAPNALVASIAPVSLHEYRKPTQEGPVARALTNLASTFLAVGAAVPALNGGSDGVIGSDGDRSAAPSASTANACGDVDAQVDQDACGNIVAVSLTGNAQGGGCTGDVSCVTVSGTNNATNEAGDNSCASSASPATVGCIAVSGTGHSTNSAGSGSCAARASIGVGAGCVAVSGTGDARNQPGPYSCTYGLNAFAQAVNASCWAVSGTGQATSGCAREADPLEGLPTGCRAVVLAP